MIGVIADDLTGAAELGAAGLGHGLRAQIVMGVEPSGQADLVCSETDSRFCAPVEAGRRTAAAAALLLKTAAPGIAGVLTGDKMPKDGASWIYKKVDSVLRGQVIAELEAIMVQRSLDLALLVPANPSLGRVIQDGEYFVGGRPIHQTEFARDPWHPRTSSQVLDLLGTPRTFPHCVCRVGQPLPAFGIIVGEAATSADVRHWASYGKARLLLAGGAEFFSALLEINGHSMRALPFPPVASGAGRELFVSGSASEAAREFVESAQTRGTPVFSLPVILAQGAEFTPALLHSIAKPALAALRLHRRIILNIGLPLVREAAIAKNLAVYLTQVAAAVLRQAAISRVYADGGATAIELARQMGWTRLNVLGELAPGVATLGAEGGESLKFTIKPGSYVWPQWLRSTKF